MTSGYKNFHGKKPRKITNMLMHIPGQLIFLGKAHKIEYICDKKNGGGDGKKAIYVHKFGKTVNLYMDERNKKQLYLIGADLKVTDAGIEN
jgi:hypothetical protein